MNIAIDLDGTLTAYPEFFVELGRAWRARGHRLYIITGLGHRSAVDRLQKVIDAHGDGFYDALHDTAEYDDAERAMIGQEPNNEIIVGLFKQRLCRALNIRIMFDDMAAVHRPLGDTPIFEVPRKA